MNPRLNALHVLDALPAVLPLQSLYVLLVPLILHEVVYVSYVSTVHEVHPVSHQCVIAVCQLYNPVEEADTDFDAYKFNALQQRKLKYCCTTPAARQAGHQCGKRDMPRVLLVDPICCWVLICCW